MYSKLADSHFGSHYFLIPRPQMPRRQHSAAFAVPSYILHRSTSLFRHSTHTSPGCFCVLRCPVVALDQLSPFAGPRSRCPASARDSRQRSTGTPYRPAASRCPWSGELAGSCFRGVRRAALQTTHDLPLPARGAWRRLCNRDGVEERQRTATWGSLRLQQHSFRQHPACSDRAVAAAATTPRRIPCAAVMLLPVPATEEAQRPPTVSGPPPVPPDCFSVTENSRRAAADDIPFPSPTGRTHDHLRLRPPSPRWDWRSGYRQHSAPSIQSPSLRKPCSLPRFRSPPALCTHLSPPGGSPAANASAPTAASAYPAAFAVPSFPRTRSSGAAY
mmetsp:Transcript_16396/g.40502  ORF Transcript_16396/g.40502 Transcript_16396/m.40502 type:complete len:331 (-) Transcript_16396:1687-2679(-)